MIEGDLLRLVGDFDGAEAAYQRASELGRDPQPGLALLRLAQGRVDVADAMIRRVLGETEDPMSRARLLGPYVEIVLAAGDTAAARVAADELRVIAAELGTPLLRAHAARATGAVLLAEGDADGRARRAARAPSTSSTPSACATKPPAPGSSSPTRAQRSATTTRPRWSRARPVPCSTSLGAADDRTRHRAGATSPDGLTQRELEVLVLLARGKTNRAIAQELFISEKTVASHVSHIFTKLGVDIALRRHRLRLRPRPRRIGPRGHTSEEAAQRLMCSSTAWLSIFVSSSAVSDMIIARALTLSSAVRHCWRR